ncbi:hypothetical protein YC2023_118835 [Brassica napus]
MGLFPPDMWLGKSVLSRALTLPKKQLESLFVSSLIRKKQPPHYHQHNLSPYMDGKDKKDKSFENFNNVSAISRRHNNALFKLAHI